MTKKSMDYSFYLQRTNYCQLVRTPGLHADVDLVFTTRRGGVSFNGTELNMSRGSGDEDSRVYQNRERVFRSIGACTDNVAILRQVHGHGIVCLDEESIPEFNKQKVKADGLMTTRKGLWLSISIGDCVPVCLYDPQKRVLAMLHSGWRSTVARISAHCLVDMQKKYGCEVDDILVLIGPGISPASYQVDQPVIDAFERASFDTDNILLDRTKGHAYLNIHEAITQTLLDKGICREKIKYLDLCTHTLSSLFFSHRRDGLPGGRMMALARLRP